MRSLLIASWLLGLVVCGSACGGKKGTNDGQAPDGDAASVGDGTSAPDSSAGADATDAGGSSDAADAVSAGDVGGGGDAMDARDATSPSDARDATSPPDARDSAEGGALEVSQDRPADAASDGAALVDLSGDACDQLGCTVQMPSTFCGAGKIMWVCGGRYDGRAFLDAGCTDPATGVQRFCCPSGVFAGCQ